MGASKDMGVTIEKQVFGSVYSDATTAPTSQQLTKTNILEYIVDVGTSLDDLFVPSEGRWMVLPPWACGLLEKSDLKNAALTGDSVSPIRKGYGLGRLDGMIAGFTIYKSSNLTNGVTASVSLPTHALAGTKDGVCFASQFTKTETLRLQDTFGNAVRGLNVYGFKTTKADALAHLSIYK